MEPIVCVIMFLLVETCQLHLNRLKNGNITVTSLSDAPSRRPVPHPVATFKQALEHYGKITSFGIWIAISLMQLNVGEIFEMCVSKFNKPTPIQVSCYMPYYVHHVFACKAYIFGA